MEALKQPEETLEPETKTTLSF
jgi:hypothetical protein